MHKIVSHGKIKKENDFGTGISEDVMESLARALLSKNQDIL